MNPSDSELLRIHQRDGSEDAFKQLVERHMGLVYHTALRVSNGDVHLAEDIAQTVFCELARKAPSLAPTTFLTAHLHRLAHSRAVDAIRSERRRRQREQEATEMTKPDQQSEGIWTRSAPLVDQTLEQLAQTDREALLARFFREASFREVGAETAVLRVQLAGLETAGAQSGDAVRDEIRRLNEQLGELPRLHREISSLQRQNADLEQQLAGRLAAVQQPQGEPSTNSGTARETEQHGQILAAADAETLLAELSKEPDARVSPLPAIQTDSGKFGFTKTKSGDGEKVQFNATPQLAMDGHSLDLKLDTLWRTISKTPVETSE